MVKFYEFLQFGTLNGVCLGNTAPHIRKILGEPTGILYKNHKPSILQYDELQFFFDFNEDNRRSEVWCIILEFFLSRQLSFPSIVLPEDWFPNSLSTDKQFHKYLVKHGLNWKEWMEFRDANFPDEIIYTVEQTHTEQTHISFRKTRKSYRLDTISVSVHYCPCPLTVREVKNDATESEIAAKSQNDPVETDVNRE